MIFKYTINNLDSFQLNHIFECGQCFRWNQELDESYTWIFWNNVLNVRQNWDSFFFQWMLDWDEDNMLEVIHKYFDLDRNYGKIKQELSSLDDYMRESIKYWQWIRLLNQNLWETIVSFIISANNNIPRIKWIIERISKKYWTEIVWNNRKYYTFPMPEQLKDVTILDYRKLWLWFRDQRLYETVRMVLDAKIDLSSLYKKDTETVREELLNLSWIWPKVADCILLFSDLKRLEVFPIDVRVRRVMNYLYIHNIDEKKVNKNEIKKLAQEKFWDYAWLAQEYLFYRARTNLKFWNK